MDIIYRKDEHCDHLLLVSSSGQDVGVVRLFPPTLKLGRLAIVKSQRGTGAGKQFMNLIESFICSGQGKSGNLLKQTGEWEIGKATIQCSSQKEARPFYEKVQCWGPRKCTAREGAHELTCELFGTFICSVVGLRTGLNIWRCVRCTVRTLAQS